MDRILCFLMGHKWSMYRGFEQIEPHYTATCLRCGKWYKPI